MEKQSKILVTGASGLIGSALVRLLRAEGYESVLTPSSDEVDCRLAEDVDDYFLKHCPEYVFHLAAHVGGIQDNNDNPATFIYNNTMMQCVVFNACRFMKVKKLLFPGSACAYPRDAEQPIKESSFMQGMPEPTNIAYAAAKINGIIMAQSYAKEYGMNVVLPMVANAYGQKDRSSHVIPNLINKMCAANRNDESEVILWGTGTPLREFIYVDDVASAFLFLMKNYNSCEIINIGTMEEVSICDLANRIAFLVGYKGKIFFDDTMPDGISRKILDSSFIYQMGWKHKGSLDHGLKLIWWDPVP